MISPSNHSLHRNSISVEIYDRVIGVLLEKDHIDRLDKALEILQIENNPVLFSEVQREIHEHTCSNCLQIRPLMPNREGQHSRYMKMNTVQRSEFSNDKDAISAYIKLDEKFYQEVYCSWCGNMKKMLSPEEEVKNFKSHYQ